MWRATYPIPTLWAPSILQHGHECQSKRAASKDTTSWYVRKNTSTATPARRVLWVLRWHETWCVSQETLDPPCRPVSMVRHCRSVMKDHPTTACCASWSGVISRDAQSIGFSWFVTWCHCAFGSTVWISDIWFTTKVCYRDGFHESNLESPWNLTKDESYSLTSFLVSFSYALSISSEVQQRIIPSKVKVPIWTKPFLSWQ